MTLHPDVLKKAQNEIDSVVGNDRLPDYADRQNLPYVDALVKEVLRWNSVVPIGTIYLLFLFPFSYLDLLGVPHRVMEDDIYNGYFIPKGSLVIANIWQVLLSLSFWSSSLSNKRQLTHDPRTYTNPMTFNPDRFLPSENRKPELDPRQICFGFGRRYVHFLLQNMKIDLFS